MKKIILFSSGDDDLMDEVYKKETEGNAKLNRQLLGSNVCSDKQDFKGHLTGLYNGLANIMKSTCQIETAPSSSAPFVVEKAVHNIMFIKHHMKRQDEFDAVISQLHLSLLFLIKSMIPFLRSAGRSRLGNSCHGARSSIPLDIQHLRSHRQPLHSHRFTLYLRQHPTYRCYVVQNCYRMSQWTMSRYLT